MWLEEIEKTKKKRRQIPTGKAHGLLQDWYAGLSNAVIGAEQMAGTFSNATGDFTQTAGNFLNDWWSNVDNTLGLSQATQDTLEPASSFLQDWLASASKDLGLDSVIEQASKPIDLAAWWDQLNQPIIDTGPLDYWWNNLASQVQDIGSGVADTLDSIVKPPTTTPPPPPTPTSAPPTTTTVKPPTSSPLPPSLVTGAPPGHTEIGGMFIPNNVMYVALALGGAAGLTAILVALSRRRK